jgi:hypothetical protein
VPSATFENTPTRAVTLAGAASTSSANPPGGVYVIVVDRMLTKIRIVSPATTFDGFVTTSGFADVFALPLATSFRPAGQTTATGYPSFVE